MNAHDERLANSIHVYSIHSRVACRVCPFPRDDTHTDIHDLGGFVSGAPVGRSIVLATRKRIGSSSLEFVSAKKSNAAR